MWCENNQRKISPHSFLFLAGEAESAGKDDDNLKYRWDKKYLYWGVTIFLVVLASLASIGIIFQFQSLMGTIGWIIGIFEPILYGLVIAFLVNPIVKNLEKLFFEFFAKKFRLLPNPKNGGGSAEPFVL